LLLWGFLLVAGCDDLTVRSFSGSIVQLAIQGADPTRAGKHLELWARDPYDDILRISSINNILTGDRSYGFVIRQAISLDSPCMIDGAGHLLITADAYPSSVTVAGITQTPEQQAQQVVNRIKQVTAAPAGTQASSLMAVIPWQPTPEPVIPEGTAPADRLAACQAYEAASPLTYVPNPGQITAPLHGYVNGFIAYVTSSGADDGIRIDTPVRLAGLQELFFTIENDGVDANSRGPLYLTSKRTKGGRDVIHFDLSGSGVSGTAAVYVNLDQDSVQY